MKMTSTRAENTYAYNKIRRHKKFRNNKNDNLGSVAVLTVLNGCIMNAPPESGEICYFCYF